ncbi:hypothetical protein YQE_12738, partial [Dendroctonus ponderosae]
MKFQDRKNFKKLFHGTGEMVSNLCRNGTYQEEFLKYAPCMQTIEKENEVCFNQYNRKMNEIQAKTPMDDITQEDILISQEAFSKTMKRKRDAADEGIKNVCCSFQEYVECSTSTTRTACGSEAADFNRKFLDKMSSSMIQFDLQYGYIDSHATGVDRSYLGNIKYVMAVIKKQALNTTNSDGRRYQI